MASPNSQNKALGAHVSKKRGVGDLCLTKAQPGPSTETTRISAHRAVRVRWCPHKPFNFARFAEYLSASLASGHVTNGGPLQEILAAKLAAVTGSRRPIVPAASGTAALHALAAAWALRKGRPLRWATQAFTFPTSFQGPMSNAFVLDLDPVHWGPCLKGLNERREDIDGIVVTNVFGHQADVHAYEAWCADNDKLLIFDNAATPRGRLPDGRSVHDAGDGAIISLHETKQIGRGEGGAVAAPPELKSYVLRALNFGFDIPSGCRVGDRLASNYRMSDIAAAATLDHLDTVMLNGWAAQLNGLAAHAEQCLLRAGLSTHRPRPDGTMPACVFVKLPPSSAVKGSHACEALCALTAGAVEAKQYYRPLVDRRDAPVAWDVYDTCVCLPLHVDMSEADVDYACAALAAVVQSK